MADFAASNSGFRRRDVRLCCANPLVRLSDASVLQFLLPLIVDERIFAGSHRGFRLLHLRAKIVVPQLDEQIPRFHRLIIGNRHRCHQSCHLRAERREVRPYVGVVGFLHGSLARPCIPVARDQKHNPDGHEQNDRRDQPLLQLLKPGVVRRGIIRTGQCMTSS